MDNEAKHVEEEIYFDTCLDDVLKQVGETGNMPTINDVMQGKLLMRDYLDIIGSQRIQIKYLVDGLEHAVPSEKGDWIDLRAAKDVELKKGEFKLIPLGVVIRLPKGYEALLVPRSSTYKNFHIIQTNSIGVIDNSYCGPNDEWKMPVYATEDTVIHKNDRICQFRMIENQPNVVFVPYEEDEETEDRGGFGSTGIQ